MLKLAFTGDVMLGRGVNEAILALGPAYPWGNSLGILREADLRLINLECVITTYTEPWTKTPKVFFFRADPLALESLKIANIDYASLANNHTLDFQEQGLEDCLKLLEENEIAYAGAGLNIEQAAAPAILEKKGTKIGVISITDNEPAWAAGRDKPGTYFLPINVSANEFKELKQRIAKVKAEVDILVLSAHWGPNMVERPSPMFRQFARATIDAGVNIFHGHSAHIFQGIEIYKDKVIFYDTGDFVDDYVVDPVLRNDLSFIFMVEVEKGNILQIVLIPTLISNYQVNLAPATEADWALQRMTKLCAEMGTTVKQKEGKLLLKVS